MYQAPSRIKIENDYLKLTPMSIKDSKSLFEAAKNSSIDIFYHMFFGPFDSIKEIENYIKSEISNENNVIYTVY
jgi:hypothetical protein